jgi:CubicO group peptidase (beta-lactamase class C family)
MQRKATHPTATGSTPFLNGPRPSERRRSLLGISSLGLTAPLGMTSLGLVACATDPALGPQDGASDAGRVKAGASGAASAFRFEGGVGRNPGGPDRGRYVDITGRFGTATPANWWRAENSVDAFSRLDQIFDARPTPGAAPGAARTVVRAAQEPTIRYLGAGPRGSGQFGIDDYCERNPVTGLLIARDNEVLVERYQYGRGPEHRMTSFSMAKTLTAILTGLALAQGRIRSIDDPAERYATGLRGTEYGRTPLRHLLTMSSGVRFREDYDGTDDSAILSRRGIQGQSAGGAQVVTPFNEREARPGDRWYYASAETFVLALATREAFGEPLSRVFAREIWQPMGAQSAASWLVDRSGLEVGYMGFQATLPDWGRLGMMLAEGGRVGRRQIVPSDWLTEMTRMQVNPRQTRRFFGYGYQTWIFPDGDGSFALLGVRGQALYVHPARQLVMVHTAVRPDARDAGGADAVALWRALKTL